jgi:DNA-binding MarR family transcriptional regulator
MKTSERTAAIELIQRCYPQIYLACHVRHVRAASTPHRLSARDSSLLVHLSPTNPISPGALAAHMGVGAPSLSAAIARLSRLGYLRRERNPKDQRAVALTLTPQGSKAMAATSVLDPERLAATLAKLTGAERRDALRGIELLAKACCQLSQELAADKKGQRGKELC